MGFWRNLKAAAGLMIGRPINDPLIRAMTMAWDEAQGLARPTDFKSQVEANKHWVYVCVRLIANSLASSTLRLYVRRGGRELRGEKYGYRYTRPATLKQMEWLADNPSPVVKEMTATGDIEEVTDHPFLSLLQNVNPVQNRFDLLHLSEGFMQLTGNCYWYFITDARGVPSQIWIVQPQYMKIMPSKQSYIGGYLFEKGMEKVGFAPEEIVHFLITDPKQDDLRYGRGPLMAAADEYDIYSQMNVWEKAVFTNMARPEGILQTDQPITEADFLKLKGQWKAAYGGADKAGKVAILDKGLTWQDITFNPREIAFLGGRETIPEVIMSVFGVPQTMVRVEEVRANSYAGERQFQANTMLPRLRMWEEKINEQVMPRYEGRQTRLIGGRTVDLPARPSLFVAFDNPVPDDVELDLKERELNLKLGVRTINEVRQEDLGLPPVAWGDEPYKSGPDINLGGGPPPDDEGKKALLLGLARAVADETKTLWQGDNYAENE